MDAMSKISEIGGGIVRRRFTIGERALLAGMHLTAEEIGSIANRRTLVRNGNLELYPKPPVAASAEAGQRHIVNRGGGKFDVIEGQKLNEHPLTKEDAEELATRPE